MKRELEKSLKRYLKRKIKVTLGLLVTFLITGQLGYSSGYAGKNYTNVQDTITENEYKVKVGSEDDKYYYGIFAYKNTDLKIQSETIEIVNESPNKSTTDNKKDLQEVAAIKITKNTDLVLGTEQTKSINLKVDTDKGGGAAVYIYNDHRNGTDGGSSLEINGERLEINVHSEGKGENKATFGLKRTLMDKIVK